MTSKLHVLLLEDEATDAELVERELRRGGFVFSMKRVVTREDFVSAITHESFELILADYSLPTFDGISALSVARELCPTVPFVFVSGAIGEELAIETLKSGATDYVLKERMSRLVPAVERALGEAEEHAARQRAEEALRRSEKRTRILLEINNYIVSNLDRESLFKAIVEALAGFIDFDRAILLLRDWNGRMRAHHLAGTSASGSFVPLPSRGATAEEQAQFTEEDRDPIIIQDVRAEAADAFTERLVKDEIRSYLAVPLVGKRGRVGSLSLCSQTAGRYSGDDAALLLEAGNQLALAIENMLAYEEIARLKARIEREKVYLQEEIQLEHGFEEIVGRGPGIRKVLKAIETVAPTNATVLITGETGTGKELAARALHRLSPRRDRTLVKVNCGALPAGLIESELFGHEKGAFTGALEEKIGRFELADGGTLLLDEIGDLPLELQVKLLRVLQEGEFERVGGSRTIKADVRVLAATNRDVEAAVREGRFRSDLFYRLNVFPVHMPPLRECRDSIPLLARHFVMTFGSKLGKSVKTVGQDVIDALAAYPWPGNVRELQNVIERGMILSRGPSLELGDWPPGEGSADADVAGGTLELREVERRHIRSVLELCNWRVAGPRGAARLLGLKPTTLEARMKKLGIVRPR